MSSTGDGRENGSEQALMNIREKLNAKSMTKFSLEVPKVKSTIIMYCIDFNLTF